MPERPRCTAPRCAGGCRGMDRSGREPARDTAVSWRPSDASAVPGAANVIAGSCEISLDVRHRDDAARGAAVATLLDGLAGSRRGGGLTSLGPMLDHVGLDGSGAGGDARTRRPRPRHPVHHMASGAGHDAMIMAARMPAAMLFLRSPAGISHHPDETVLEDDVAAALGVGAQFSTTSARTRACRSGRPRREVVTPKVSCE